MTDVAANWALVRERVARAAARAGRDPGALRVVAASKTQPVELLQQAIAAGVTDVGENYVQEAVEKARHIDAPIIWHLIGHLQRNKAAHAVALFSLIHTLDSTGLGDILARHGDRRGQPVRVLIEVNVGGEATKRGVPPAGVQELLTAMAAQSGIEIDGLMAIPPPAPVPEAARPYFRLLRELRDRLRERAPRNAPLRELSMGMSDDFEVAIEEGATILRVGRAIFGERRRSHES
jgi:pyridoxal phosphate enzyme (YggS family)